MSSLYNLHVHRWGESVNVNLTIRGLCLQIATSTEDMHKVMVLLREKQVDTLLPGRPDVGTWLPMYRDHRRVQRVAMDHFPEAVGPGADAEAFTDSLRGLSNMAKHRPEELKSVLGEMDQAEFWKSVLESMKKFQEDYLSCLQKIHDEFSGKHEAVRELGETMKASPEVLFYFRVVLPCVGAFKMHPTKLMSLARQPGPFQGTYIERLIRLDDMAIYEPRIAAWRNAVDGQARIDRLDMIRLWERNGLQDGQFTRTHLKQVMGGMIWALAEFAGATADLRTGAIIPAKVEADQIRELYHCVARDRAMCAGKSSEGVYDADIADLQIGSWRRRVSEHKEEWAKFLRKGG